jgi:hypothetical protein
MVLSFPEFLRISENSKFVLMNSFTLCYMLLSDTALHCIIWYLVMFSIANIQCNVIFEVSTAVMLNIKCFWDVNNRPMLADV